MELSMKWDWHQRISQQSSGIIWFMFLKIRAGYFMVKGKNAFSNAFLQIEGGGVQF